MWATDTLQSTSIIFRLMSWLHEKIRESLNFEDVWFDPQGPMRSVPDAPRNEGASADTGTAEEDRATDDDKEATEDDGDAASDESERDDEG